MSSARPASQRKLLAKGETFSDDDSPELYVVWMEDSKVFLTTNIPYMTFDENHLNELDGRMIPREDLYPLWRDDVTEAPTVLPPDTYIKMPYWHCYKGRTNLELINGEIDILEMLSKKQHPSIVQYLGCVRDGDYITGICLKKYVCTLGELISEQVPAERRPPFDEATVISDIKSGLDFLHGLGLVHDDISPRNIMLQEDGHAVIIDFDSCTAVGNKSRGGTPGWSTNPPTAQFENDEYGLDLVSKFIHHQYDGQNFDAFGF